jgi:hypothetical protein
MRKQRNYGIRALNSSGLIAMNNANISPITNPIIVPAATPRQSTFCSLVVISTFQRHVVNQLKDTPLPFSLT